ncbi:MAG: hypothetical protein R3D63_06055 [Paracoccaceae bacterium]
MSAALRVAGQRAAAGQKHDRILARGNAKSRAIGEDIGHFCGMTPHGTKCCKTSMARFLSKIRHFLPFLHLVFDDPAFAIVSP